MLAPSFPLIQLLITFQGKIYAHVNEETHTRILIVHCVKLQNFGNNI